MHLEPSDASVHRLIKRGIEGPVTMLNLLRLRAQADYSAFPKLAPAQPVSGLEAYQRYVRHTLPFLSDSGGSLEFIGSGGHYLVGPSEERWDLVMLVKQPSIAAFLAFASNEAYMAGIGHRTAALEDSRLLALLELERPAAAPAARSHQPRT